MIIKWKSIKKYCTDFLKVNHNSPDDNCSCASVSTNFFNNMAGNKNSANNKKSSFGDYENRILENIGYFVSSNDEKKTPKYYPTSLQDIDPNGLA
jgi:hypothetical protein